MLGQPGHDSWRGIFIVFLKLLSQLEEAMHSAISAKIRDPRKFLPWFKVV